jgi:phosphoglycolate phosphatase-like HAD superfamily hydrolase
MIKAVLFDLDDTLIDHDGAIRSAAGALFDNLRPNTDNNLSGICSNKFCRLGRRMRLKINPGVGFRSSIQATSNATF